jgi:hypothetical protein
MKHLYFALRTHRRYMLTVLAKDKEVHDPLLSSVLEVTLNLSMLDTVLGVWCHSVFYPLLVHVLEIYSTNAGRLAWPCRH